jgi:hypothetical protein
VSAGKRRPDLECAEELLRVEIAVTDDCNLLFSSDWFIAEVKVDTINNCFSS